MSNKAASVYATAMQQAQKSTPKVAQESARKPAHPRQSVRDGSREKPRKPIRKQSNNLPSRDEIQIFSFELRDTLKSKVQAEVPHEWQQELEEIAHTLKVKKLELYRYIFGEFLGKVTRNSG